MREYFIKNDYRGELRYWVEKNCLSHTIDFVKKITARNQIIEHLSFELLNRSDKYGIAKEKIIIGIKFCGKHGECQYHKTTGDERFCVYNCQYRKFHIPCAIRYRAGQGVEDMNQFMEIVDSLDLWGFYKWEFTLPGEVRAWIDENVLEAKEFLKDVRRAIAKTIKLIFHVDVNNDRKLQPGFKILYHPASSGDPFKQSSHFHVMALPLLCDLNQGRTETFPKIIDEKEVKRIYKLNLDKILKKYEIPGAVKANYNVHLSYMEREMTSKIIHSFKYNNRSMTQDVLNKVQRVNFPGYSEYVCVLTDTKTSEKYPEIKTENQMLDALEFVLNPPLGVRMSYGFLNRLPSYSLLLGIVPDDYEQDENWQRSFLTEYRRTYKTQFDKNTGRLKTITEVWVRRKDGDGPWMLLSPEDLRGEKTSMSGRKLYKCSNPKKRRFFKELDNHDRNKR